MSGGRFDYQQYRLNDIADELRKIIASCRLKKNITKIILIILLKT